MAKKESLHPLYIAFLVLMALILLAGLFLLVYGSMNNGLPVPSLPGDVLRALAERLCHG